MNVTEWMFPRVCLHDIGESSAYTCVSCILQSCKKTPVLSTQHIQWSNMSKLFKSKSNVDGFSVGLKQKFYIYLFTTSETNGKSSQTSMIEILLQK